MSRRSSRRRRSSRSRSRSSSRRRSPSKAANATPSEPVDLAVEYHYVIEDLKRIGIIAAGLIAGLVVLSFFL
jgi:hypothetical protein